MTHPAIEAAERAVITCRRMGVDDLAARTLVRVEINMNTEVEIMRDLNPADYPDRSFNPLKIRGVAYYTARNPDVPWKVIGPAWGTGGRLVHNIITAPAAKDDLAEPEKMG